MARPLEFDKEEVLQKALEVFWSKGYEASSLTDLLTAMDISKSSFYQSFGSKCEVFISCLSLYIQCMKKELAADLLTGDNKRKNLEKMLLDVCEDVSCHESQKGCFLSNVAVEFAQKDNDVAKKVSEGLSVFESSIKEAFKTGQEEGSISNSSTADELAKLYVTIYSGLKMKVKSGSCKEDVCSSISTFLKLF